MRGSGQALLKRVREGDGAAAAELIEAHGKYLFGIAYALLHDRHSAEDVVQETFVAVLRAQYRGEAAVRTWLVGILIRQARMHQRKQRRWLKLWPGGEPDAARDAATGPVEPAVDARLDLAEMLKDLSAEHREIILLREIEGMSYDEIGQALSIPRGTVESRLHRAREQLRAVLNKENLSKEKLSSER